MPDDTRYTVHALRIAVAFGLDELRPVERAAAEIADGSDAVSQAEVLATISQLTAPLWAAKMGGVFTV